MTDLLDQIAACRLCAEDFAATHTAHEPRPVAWFAPRARILIAGQAPGLRVHQSGIPFNDPSGDRLRAWMAVTREEFYDRDRIAIVPMAFCFPGYDARKADLPPPPRCAKAWREEVMAQLNNVQVTILVGGHAFQWHLGRTSSVTDTVKAWRRLAKGVFPLPHPSWRNSGWLKKNPWFEADVLPELRLAIREALE